MGSRAPGRLVFCVSFRGGVRGRPQSATEPLCLLGGGGAQDGAQTSASPPSASLRVRIPSQTPSPPPSPPTPPPAPPHPRSAFILGGGGAARFLIPFSPFFSLPPPPPQPTSRCRSRAISWTRCCSWSCSGTKRPNWFGNTTRRGAKRDPPPRNALTDAPPPSGAAAASNASTVEEPPPLPPLPKAGATGGASRAAGAAPGGASVVEEGAAEVEEEVRTPRIRPVGVGGGAVGDGPLSLELGGPGAPPPHPKNPVVCLRV